SAVSSAVVQPGLVRSYAPLGIIGCSRTSSQLRHERLDAYRIARLARHLLRPKWRRHRRLRTPRLAWPCRCRLGVNRYKVSRPIRSSRSLGLRLREAPRRHAGSNAREDHARKTSEVLHAEVACRMI